MRYQRGLGALLAGGGLLAILALTLVPNPRQAGVADVTPLLCVVCGEAGGADVALNLLLFLPLAAGLALLGWPWWRTVALCGLLSLGVEAVQFFAGTGRDASLSDLLTNTISGAVGAAIGRRPGLLLNPGPTSARRLSLGAAAAWLTLLSLTAASMRPWAPAGPLHNYCTPAFPTAELFAGTAKSMVLNGVALSCDEEVGEAAALREQLRRGEVELATLAESGKPTTRRRIIHVVRAPNASLVILAQHDRAAVFQAPTAAQSLGFFAPALRLSRVFPRRGGVPVELAGSVEGRRLHLAAGHDGGRSSVELRLSPSFGWTLLFAVPLEPGATLRLAAALWLGGLILPAAYWGGRSVRPVEALGAAGGAVIAGLGLLPAATGFDPAHWSEWLGAAGGAGLGWAVSRIAAYLQSRCGSPSTSAFSSS
jgi:hypothetical protein